MASACNEQLSKPDKRKTFASRGFRTYTPPEVCSRLYERPLVLPAVKYGFGYGQACVRVRVAGADTKVSRQWSGNLQYLVWDSFSATRTTFFSEGLLRFVKRYNGRAVHTESVTVTTPDGSTTVKPIIIIYEVRP